jgi:poly(A) polymerase
LSVTKVSPSEQRELAVHVLRKLREAGYRALWAGGCVRDQLLGRTPNDYDVATSATPPEIRQVFGRRHTLEIGAAFGVVAVLGGKGAGMVEVTTFRRDAQYSDGRHPDAIVFSTPEDDAQRRDFTINGLFYDPLEERVIDYVGGVADLERRLVRAIGDPRARFSEDKLRMIRAVRIAAGFDFALDEATLKAIDEMANTINVVSPERIAQEMRKMLVHAQRAEAVELLHRSGLLQALLPELLTLISDEVDVSRTGDPTPHGVDLWRHTRQVLAALREPTFPLALAALAHASAEQPPHADNPQQVESARAQAVQTVTTICERWRLSNKEQDRATWLVEHHGRLTDAARQPWSTLQPLLVAAGGSELVALHEAEAADAADVALQHAADVEFCRARLAWPQDQLIPPPLISGDDLARHGVPKGAIYRMLLERVRNAQLDGQILDQRQALAVVDRLLAEKG